jgi:hypothetical protein
VQGARRLDIVAHLYRNYAHLRELLEGHGLIGDC